MGNSEIINIKLVFTLVGPSAANGDQVAYLSIGSSVRCEKYQMDTLLRGAELIFDGLPSALPSRRISRGSVIDAW